MTVFGMREARCLGMMEDDLEGQILINHETYGFMIAEWRPENKCYHAIGWDHTMLKGVLPVLTALIDNPSKVLWHVGIVGDKESS